MPRHRILTWWFGLMVLGGFAFGLFAERRPFGNAMFEHPLIVFAAVVAVGLLALRVGMQRPVPEFIPERALVAGCLLGAGTYLIGNWIEATFLHGQH